MSAYGPDGQPAEADSIRDGATVVRGHVEEALRRLEAVLNLANEIDTSWADDIEHAMDILAACGPGKSEDLGTMALETVAVREVDNGSKWPACGGSGDVAATGRAGGW